MYFHPLQEEIGNLSEEEISKRIQELNKKHMSARRFSSNPELVNQIFPGPGDLQDRIEEPQIEKLGGQFQESPWRARSR
jgi:hypothetical protein